ncbi:chondroitin sulfate proteoglycan 4 [Spea bombifrons]|uniref:chondroitin sulfate proteoglycan 4 n=1 Tax=Spea bombifrons TaxID=233779 RepID=UPI00234ADE64|nr:chondroitin sulfate proteoglycan 4 [Spea bombifrons]
MAGRHWLLLLLLGGVLRDMGIKGQHNTADSQIQDRVDSRLQVTFVTTRTSGLIFLASGENQYLLVELANGTIRAKLDKGNGESVINAIGHISHYSLETHKLDLVVTESKMAITLDNLNSSADLLWSPDTLNFNHGLFLGGVGKSDSNNLTENIPTFYGCIVEARFNGIDLLSNPLVKLHGQWEGCQSIPISSMARSFGFLGPRSYLIFPGWDASTKSTIQLTLVTSRAGRAPLLYQSGPRRSYFYIGIAGGHLQMNIVTGETVVQIENNVYISDSRPHKVKILVDSSEVQLAVDKSLSKLPIGDLEHEFDFHGNLYLGGVDETILAKMRDGPLGDLYADDMEYRSFIGCFADLMVNSVKKGLRDAMLTKDVTAECHDYEYDDYIEYEDTITPILTTIVTPLNKTTHLGQSTICKPNPNHPYITSLVSTQPLSVTRGESTILELSNIQPTIDLGKIGIRKSQVVLSIVGSAQHGLLELEIPGAETRRKFTLLDVAHRKVHYIHDGSQSHKDRLSFEVSVTSGINLPECLRKVQQHTLEINVLPAVTLPNLMFPKGKTLGIISHRMLTLTTDIIQITDTDTNCDKVTFSISGNSTEGHVELKHKPGVAVREFSCMDLKEGKVVFIHKSGNQVQLTIQVHGRTSTSFSANFTILALEVIESREANLIVSPGASALITSSYLPIFTNAETLGVEIIYQLAEHPKLGEVQKLTDMGQWKITEDFKLSDLIRHSVRYFSKVADLHGEEMNDELGIQMKLGSQVVHNKTLQVKIRESNIQVIRNIPLRVGRKRKVKITDKVLQAESVGMDLNLTSLTYMILQSPRKGNLQLEGQRLTEGSHFTQQDLQNGLISYEATVRNTEEMEDQFQFQVTLGAQISPVYTHKILIGVDPDAPELTNQLLHALEGEEVGITPEHLFLKSGNNVNFVYEVIDGPQHGVLIRKDSQREVGIVEFTNEDIIKGQLVYQHDGSETTEDDIPFVASRQREGSATDTSGEEEDDEEEEEVMRGVFRVSIQLVNDNPPVQLVRKVFHVVRDGQKLLTTNDIAFSDPDLGTTDAQLVLVRYGVPFGKIVLVDDPSLLVFRFTQDDLRMHRILYIHNGPDQGSIQLQVSDGLYHLTTVLEIQASDPFIQIANLTMLTIPSGGRGTLTATSLNLETNLDIREEDEIRYHIISPPRWGELLKGGKPTDSFSQLDLAEGQVVYQHSVEGARRDNFRISVEANQVLAFGEIQVQVGTEIPAVTPRVIHNEKVYVFQEEAAEIKKEHLLVSAEDTFPHKVIYTLTDPPAFGYLVAVSTEPSSDGSASLDSVQTFTQDDINQGRIMYLHSASEMLPDRMTLEVTVGGETSLEIVVLIEILPFYIPLEVTELKVKEGDIATLTTGILQVSSEYFLGLHLEFIIMFAPSRGRIVNADKEDLRTFSWNELDQGRVFYEHDGSETLSDNFTVVVNATDINHQSQPVTINVTVQAVNDERPHVVTNRGLEILEEDTVNIDAQVLQTIDADSLPEELVYSILPPTNGQLVLKGSSGGVLSFTQKQVDQGLLQFQHKGPLDGGFFFTVSDGEHQSLRIFFQIHAIPFTITMKSIQNLIVCPQSFKPITSQHLMAVTNERKDPPPELVYHIETPFQFGQVTRLKNGEETAITNFTQSEVDANLIYYQHVALDTPFWTVQDYISFHVTSSYVVSQRYILNVTVTFQGPCPHLQTRLWKNAGLTVLEGGSSPISRTTLDASNLLANRGISSISHDVVFLVTRLPSQGHLSIQGSPLDPVRPHFWQFHLEQESLLYSHTGSGILEDTFEFKAWLWPKLKAFHEPPSDVDNIIITETLNITIIPTPNQPPLMSTPSSSLNVAPGSHAALSPVHLSVQDRYSPPDKILYTVIDLPVGITVTKHDNMLVPISHFTQDDLAKLNIVIVANSTASSGTMLFSVGHQSPTIMMVPVKVPAVYKAVLEVPQALGTSVLTIDHVPPVVEGMSQEVLYKVTKQPTYGQLIAGNVPVTEFSWKQLKEGDVFYMFTSFSSSYDEFRFLAMSYRGEEVAGLVAISVSGMAKIGDQELWPRGCTVKLGRETVDASELAMRTASVPEFRVLRQPRGGRLVRFPQKKGKGKGKTTDSFNQLELEKGLIGVELWEDGQSGTEIQSDRIHMELRANRVPPANITVRFSTIAYNSSYPYRVTLLRVLEVLKTTPYPIHQISTTAMDTKNLEPNTQLDLTTHLIAATRIQSTTHSESSTYSQSITHIESTTTNTQSNIHSEPTTHIQSTTHSEPKTYIEFTTHLQPTTSQLTTHLETTTPLKLTTHFKTTTNIDSTKQLEPAATLESTTHFNPTTQLLTTTHLEPTRSLDPITKVDSTTFNTINTATVTNTVSTSPNLSYTTTHFRKVSSRFSDAESSTSNTTQSLLFNSSWSLAVPTSSTPEEDDALLGFMGAHVYNIIIPICLVLFLVAVGLLLLIYLLRRKKMGMHHVQKAATSSAKPENGASDRQNFRPTDPDRGIPLCEVGNGSGTQGQSRSQYWV